MASSSSRKYQVFVSHAGEDKHTIAFPLRDMLRSQGITTFVDEKDIPPGCSATDEMTSAMKNAHVAVIVLSPEFVAKKWPMKELLFFLDSREKARAVGAPLPIVIPVFYRLQVADMYTEPRFDRVGADGKSLYRTTRFFERRDNGEPEANIAIIQHALRTLHGIMGITNEYRASNDVSSLPARLLLLEDVCAVVSEAIAEQNEKAVEGETLSTSGAMERFRRHFDHEPLRDVVLDFDSVDTRGEPLTQEGRIKRRILNVGYKSEQLVAIVGGGGVGKSTILKSLMNDEDIMRCFYDGLYVIPLGMDADREELFRELRRMLRVSGAESIEKRLRDETTLDNLDSAIRDAIRDAILWFRGRSCAFFIDDIWTSKIDFGVFSCLFKLGGKDQRSTVAFTTREHEIACAAPLTGIFSISPREVQGEMSRRMLFRHAGVTSINIDDDRTKQSVAEVLEICGGLPVSLAVAGKGVKMLAIDMNIQDESLWCEYLVNLRDYREQLLVRNVDDYGNLYITFGASIALLQRRGSKKLGFETQSSFPEMYLRLCVFRKQAKVPAFMLKLLWELKSDSEAEAVAQQFVEVGMGEIKCDRLGHERWWHFIMHDSLHDYAIMEAKQQGKFLSALVILLRYSYRIMDDLYQERFNWLQCIAYDAEIHAQLKEHLLRTGAPSGIADLYLRRYHELLLVSLDISASFEYNL